MIDKLKLYISAAPDLGTERDALARAVAEVPTSLGFTITQTPTTDREPDLAAVAGAHVHLLILGSDIQAPVGLEWATARRRHKAVALFFKSSVARTQAAQAFMRDVAKLSAWQSFDDVQDLHGHVVRLIIDHLLALKTRYEIANEEVATLRAWREGLAGKRKRGRGGEGGLSEAGTPASGVGESAVILSIERFVPSEGVLLRPGDKTR